MNTDKAREVVAEMRAEAERLIDLHVDTHRGEIIPCALLDRAGELRDWADRLAALPSPSAGAVAWMTVYTESNAITARIHDVAHSLPPGTYSLFTHPAPTVDEGMVLRACAAYDVSGLVLEPAEYPAMHAALTAALENRK